MDGGLRPIRAVNSRGMDVVRKFRIRIAASKSVDMMRVLFKPHVKEEKISKEPVKFCTELVEGVVGNLIISTITKNPLRVFKTKKSITKVYTNEKVLSNVFRNMRQAGNIPFLLSKMSSPIVSGRSGF